MQPLICFLISLTGLPGTVVNCAADIYSFGMVALEVSMYPLARCNNHYISRLSFHLDGLESP